MLFRSGKELIVDGGIARIVLKELGETKNGAIEDKLRWWTEERQNFIQIELGLKRDNVSAVMKKKFWGKRILEASCNLIGVITNNGGILQLF